MLDIDESLRRALRSKGALTVDECGDEVLVGMTHAETIFYLHFDEPRSTVGSSGEAGVYRELENRHLRARIAQLNDRGPDIDRKKYLRQ